MKTIRIRIFEEEKKAIDKKSKEMKLTGRHVDAMALRKIMEEAKAHKAGR